MILFSTKYYKKTIKIQFLFVDISFIIYQRKKFVANYYETAHEHISTKYLKLRKHDAMKHKLKRYTFFFDTTNQF
jgi:DNA replicative helicase MCM subunit Mcm2 (Cdc46/Mcm family)